VQADHDFPVADVHWLPADQLIPITGQAAQNTGGSCRAVVGGYFTTKGCADLAKQLCESARIEQAILGGPDCSIQQACELNPDCNWVRHSDSGAIAKPFTLSSDQLAQNPDCYYGQDDCSLPPGWKKAELASGGTHYLNTKTCKTQTRHPGLDSPLPQGWKIREDTNPPLYEKTESSCKHTSNHPGRLPQGYVTRFGMDERCPRPIDYVHVETGYRQRNHPGGC
jgi:hypothetical protein